MKIQVVTQSASQTQQVAKMFAKTLSAPSVVSLVGDLGAGKTTFTQGLGQELGVDQFITSPTFTILNEYTQGKTNVYHFDMYRLDSLEEAEESGFLEYFDLDSLNGITIVEWASNTPGILPKKHYQVTLEKLGEEQRKIIIESVEKNENFGA